MLSMKFRTEYKVTPAERLLNPERAVVLLGSCFTDSIGNRMRECRWRAFPNLCGVLYNPASIANIINIALGKEDFAESVNDSIASRGEQFVTWLMDSGCTTYSKSNTEERVRLNLLQLKKKLTDAEALFVTFGTAWIYELSDRSGYVVSNCHKFPAESFVRRRLTVSEIVNIWNECLALLQEKCPGLRVIFTVSPVRHLKDGFEGNSRSKAILQLACEELCSLHECAEYFPAFEIVNDDLRDYRFYDTDLVHPSRQAVEYVWEKFSDRYLSADSRRLLAEGESVTRVLNHRPIIVDHSDLGEYKASEERYKASQRYNAFMEAHPTMLHIDE